MISLSGLVNVVVILVVAGLVFWLLYWLISFTNPPEPFKQIATVVLAVAAVLVCIFVLLSLVSGQPVLRP